ncbi:peptide ABC transporter substrate-binding protein [Acrocarpospora pleiomorpha]|uniref:Peptide ABC transporter substrate-binding protein n=1 Tax=Acrocarpospora pleiomorpha TaxID=90975 RepID=A0A5M3XFM9_9ACTN|nr:ABC transporter substrate-binding protein [Acrocarpospora pleiomorpha]GES20395.1 peptide ABC transporter substrate-binding protein [Acrocarpospora pleiomorpha]
MNKPARPQGRSRLARALLAALLIAAPACAADPADSPAAGSATSSPAPTEVRIAVPETGVSLKPDGFWHYALASYGVAEHLLRARPDGTIEPWLASSFERTDPKTWRVTLREGVTFHSGKAVDAKAVVAALEKRVTQGYGTDSIAKAEIEATGPLEVTFTSPQPSAAVPRDLASLVRYYMIYDVAAAEQAGDDNAKLLAAGIYTGPFKPVAVDQQSISAEAFPGYWGTKPALTGVKVLAMPDATARVSAVRSGEADIAITPPAETARTATQGGPFTYKRATVANRGVFAQFNLARPPFDDLAVRQAFMLGVDYAKLPAVVAGGGVYAQAGSVAPGALPFAVTTQRTDPAAAAALLDQAGWQAGADGIRAKDGKPLRVTYLFQSGDSELEAFGIALREQMRPLGIDLAMARVDDAYDSKAWPAEWTITTLFVLLDGPNLVDSMAAWLGSQGGANFGGVKDPELDGLIGTLQSTTLEEAGADLGKAQTLISEKAYAAVLGFKAVDAVVSAPFADFVPDAGFVFIDAALSVRQ